MVLFRTVKEYVDTYYVTLKEIIINADKRGEIDYDEVQDQMKAIYKRVKKAKKSNLEIFNEISEKVHKVSLQEDIYCQIVVAYFIAMSIGKSSSLLAIDFVFGGSTYVKSDGVKHEGHHTIYFKFQFIYQILKNH